MLILLIAPLKSETQGTTKCQISVLRYNIRLPENTWVVLTLLTLPPPPPFKQTEHLDPTTSPTAKYPVVLRHDLNAAEALTQADTNVTIISHGSR